MKKTRILIVGGFPPKGSKIFGGIVTSCQALIESSFSDKFDLITIDSTQKSNPIPSLYIRSIYAFKRLLKYILKILTKRPGVVILFPAIGASLIEKGVMSWIAYILGIPVLMFPRGGPLLNQVHQSSFAKCWIRMVFSSTKKVLCQGPSWKNFAMNTLRFSDEDSPIVHNWTATDELLKIGKKKLSIKQSSPLNIIYVGWLEREKGIFDLMEVCINLRKNYKFNLSIAGGGSCEKAIKTIIDNNDIVNVDFYGWVDRDQLKYILEKADILVLPSWAEGFPNAIIEAMASGVAVIVSSVGNIPDILNDQSEVLLVPPKNKNALEAAMIKLIEDDKLRSKLSENGYKFAVNNFSVGRAVNKLEKIIKSIA